MNNLDKHYKNILQKNYNLTKQDFSDPLNTKPTDSLKLKKALAEIKESIKYFKAKKAPVLGNIANKMTKCFDRNMIEHVQTLFNNIMVSVHYPTLWNQGLICSR